MSFSAEGLGGAIDARITEFLAADDQRLEWMKPHVREHGFLPLYLGWLAALGIRPDGSFVCYEYDTEEAPRLRPLIEPYCQRMAICQGARKYAELRALVPERPAKAETCDTCGGSGEFRVAPHLICGCGGCGWLIPGESRENHPG